MRRIAVVGSRDFQNELKVRGFVVTLPLYCNGQPFVVVSGGAHQRSPEYRKLHPQESQYGGVDFWAEDEADQRGFATDIIKANWKMYGRAAGMIRNEILVTSMLGKEDEVHIFWDGISSGSMNVIKNCKKHGVQYFVHGEV
jgi:hypothetical protein